MHRLSWKCLLPLAASFVATRYVEPCWLDAGSSAQKGQSSTGDFRLHSLDTWRLSKIGRYENRIRAYSHPRKVFHYFATIYKNGELHMLPEDFVRSLIPHREISEDDRPDERYRQLKTQSALEFFKLADTNGDGLISYSEYMLFLAFLLTPEEHYKIAFRVFDVDQSNTLSYAEFVHFIDSETIDSKQPFFHRLGKREQERLSDSKCHGLLSLFFGPTCHETTLSYDEFLGFMKRLRFELLKLEYYQYKIDINQNDSISLRDLGYALVSCVEHSKLNDYHKKINSMSIVNDERILFDQFVKLINMVDNIDDVTLALNICSQDENKLHKAGIVTTGKLTSITLLTLPSIHILTADFSRAVKSASNVDLTPGQLQVFAHLFGTNNTHNEIDYRLFVSAIKNRHQMGLDSVPI